MIATVEVERSVDAIAVYMSLAKGHWFDVSCVSAQERTLLIVVFIASRNVLLRNESKMLELQHNVEICASVQVRSGPFL